MKLLSFLKRGGSAPIARERSNAAEVGWARWDKKEVGKLTPGNDAWQGKFGRLLGCRDPDRAEAALPPEGPR